MMGARQKEWGRYRKKWIVFLALAVGIIFLSGRADGIAQEDNRHIYQVFCMGDSITYGRGIPEEERAWASYPARLQQFLGAGYEVTNYGASGKTLLDVSEKSYRDTGYIRLVQEQSPDILIVMLGTNDSRPANWDAVGYRDCYMELVEELKEIPGEPEIYLMAPPRAYAEEGRILYNIDNDVIKDEIHLIVEEVADQTGVYMIDLYAVTKDHPEYYTDGVHFNRDGYEALAKAVFLAIKSRKASV